MAKSLPILLIIGLISFNYAVASSNSPTLSPMPTPRGTESLSARMFRAFSFSTSKSPRSSLAIMVTPDDETTTALNDKMFQTLINKDSEALLALFGRKYVVGDWRKEPSINMVNVKDFTGLKPDTEAKKDGRTALLFLTSLAFDSCTAGEGPVSLVRIMLELGAEPNVEDEAHEWTPLAQAVAHRRWTITQLLLKHKADPMQTPKNGKSAMQHAIDRSAVWAGIVAPYCPPEVIEKFLEKLAKTKVEQRHIWNHHSYIESMRSALADFKRKKVSFEEESDCSSESECKSNDSMD